MRDDRTSPIVLVVCGLCLQSVLAMPRQADSFESIREHRIDEHPEVSDAPALDRFPSVDAYRRRNDKRGQVRHNPHIPCKCKARRVWGAFLVTTRFFEDKKTKTNYESMFALKTVAHKPSRTNAHALSLFEYRKE